MWHLKPFSSLMPRRETGQQETDERREKADGHRRIQRVLSETMKGGGGGGGFKAK